MIRAFAAAPAFMVGMFPNGDFTELPELPDNGGSMGDVADGEEPDCGGVGLGPN